MGLTPSKTSSKGLSQDEYEGPSSSGELASDSERSAGSRRSSNAITLTQNGAYENLFEGPTIYGAHSGKVDGRIRSRTGSTSSLENQEIEVVEQMLTQGIESEHELEPNEELSTLIHWLRGTSDTDLVRGEEVRRRVESLLASLKKEAGSMDHFKYGGDQEQRAGPEHWNQSHEEESTPRQNAKSKVYKTSRKPKLVESSSEDTTSENSDSDEEWMQRSSSGNRRGNGFKGRPYDTVTYRMPRPEELEEITSGSRKKWTTPGSGGQGGTPNEWGKMLGTPPTHPSPHSSDVTPRKSASQPQQDVTYEQTIRQATRRSRTMSENDKLPRRRYRSRITSPMLTNSASLPGYSTGGLDSPLYQDRLRIAQRRRKIINASTRSRGSHSYPNTPVRRKLSLKLSNQSPASARYSQAKRTRFRDTPTNSPHLASIQLAEDSSDAEIPDVFKFQNSTKTGSATSSRPSNDDDQEIEAIADSLQRQAISGKTTKDNGLDPKVSVDWDLDPFVDSGRPTSITKKDGHDNLEGQKDDDAALSYALESLSKVLSNGKQRDRLCSMKDDQAQCMIDFLYSVLLKPVLPNSWLRRRCLVALYKLSKTSQLYPQCYSLKDSIVPGHSAEKYGGFSDIFKGKFEDKELCLKIVRLNQSNMVAMLKRYAKEAILWGQLNHPNVTPFYGVFYLDSMRRQLCLVSPWMRYGDITCYLSENPSAPRPPFVYDVTCGLGYLHSLGLIHSDLKGANILVNNQVQACITDFGMSFIRNDKMLTQAMATTSVHGYTQRWASPELLEDDAQPTLASDIWAFGCVCFEILTGQLPFHDLKTDTQVIRALLADVIPGVPSSVSSPMEKLLWKQVYRCWAKEPSKRPNCDDILSKLHSAGLFREVDYRAQLEAEQESQRLRDAMRSGDGDGVDLTIVGQVLSRLQSFE
ncbi:hypothetical protein NP233_g1882 [Leucocoprinus birnbaumii]|uniref:Protein kinase domain-containing protein n=1 Tax=Leucocoprinus birnbaumii TaxID=56174 RepID=A0AAD5YUF6_9AGAR|nr:hypothetical protein NP233_g1882 [Leucocoprinus birnbaumii]